MSLSFLSLVLFFATITQQRRPGCCGCLFVVRFVFVLFKEEEEEEEEAILVGVVDDVVANENMAMLMTLIRVMCVFMCVYLRVYLRVYRIQDIMEKSTHFPPQLVNCAQSQPVRETLEERRERQRERLCAQEQQSGTIFE